MLALHCAPWPLLPPSRPLLLPLPLLPPPPLLLLCLQRRFSLFELRANLLVGNA